MVQFFFWIQWTDENGTTLKEKQNGVKEFFGDSR